MKKKNTTKTMISRIYAYGLSAVLLCTLFATSGCNGSDESVAVQSVAEVCGIGTVVDVYAGVVSARSELTIKQNSDKDIGEVKVAAGDEVAEGQVLFTYDVEKMQINYDKAALELEQMKATISAKESELSTLNKEKQSASGSDKLRYTLEIQSCETEIREQNYNLKLKQKEVERLAETLKDTEYKSPFNGRVKSVNADGGIDEYGNEKPFMELVESGAYKVKAYVNENNVATLQSAGDVIVRSRMDESQTWKGTVSSVDWENPTSSNSNYYYMDSVSSTTNSNKYPFYVELESSEGLILGQHVYIEPDLGQMDEVSGINLPAFYLFDISEDQTSAYVWAESSSGRLEKRELALSGFDPDMNTYIVTEGLEEKDYIAYPEENLKSGMKCEHNADAYQDETTAGDDLDYINVMPALEPAVVAEEADIAIAETIGGTY